MAMLKILLGMRAFGIMMGHLAHSQVILPTFPKELGLFLVVRLVALAFLRYWVLIDFVFIICFQRMITLVFCV
jgi:hypothetical protein